jgi:hypothetical protein
MMVQTQSLLVGLGNLSHASGDVRVLSLCGDVVRLDDGHDGNLPFVLLDVAMSCYLGKHLVTCMCGMVAIVFRPSKHTEVRSTQCTWALTLLLREVRMERCVNGHIVLILVPVLIYQSLVQIQRFDQFACPAMDLRCWLAQEEMRYMSSQLPMVRMRLEVQLRPPILADPCVELRVIL